ncbi:MAG: NADH-quinone oxidoreductase subunit A [Candidatus Wallbacteria bacterium]|nr:NADH-quinone oxidoreductase subunit A [Candidatus Wallbacteria bacterium]
MSEFFPLGILFLFAVGLSAGFLFLDGLLGERRPNPIKSSTYECGMETVGNARQRFHVRYFVVALLFILFDVEVVYLYPWAVLFRRMGVNGFIEVTVFMTLLVVGLIYAWRKGALEWE